MNFFIKKKKHPFSPNVYAVTTGTNVGELLVYVEEKDDKYSFLSLPSMVIREVPKDKFDLGLENKIVEVADKLPKSVYKVCLAQYKKNKSSK